MKKGFVKELALDLSASIFAGIIVAFGLHIFSSANGFAPGGINGIASILGEITGWSMGYFMIALNLPLFVLISIFVEKKLGLFLSIYVATQSVTLILLKDHFWCYKASDGAMIFAAIATGVVTGFGFALQIRRHGASGGTYAISALVKHWRPASNIAWLSFMLDSGVVLFVFIRNLVIKLCYDKVTLDLALNAAIIPTLCTLLNLFIANLVVDYCLQGAKEGYKFEIITEDPDTVSEEIMTELRHGVTELRVNGMYTHKEKYMIVCIIRKRELSKMMKILKKYPNTFSSFSRVNEVFGRFKK